MLTLHRTAANFAYAGFVVAGICGIWLYRSRRRKMQEWHENGGRLSFSVAFASFLALPIVGFFYAWVLKYHGKVAYSNLMFGRGDVVAGGIDWWWVKHIIVASMIGLGLMFNRRASREGTRFAIPVPAVYTLAIVYFMFYLGMGMQMTWLFFWVSLGAAVLAGLWGNHLMNRHGGSGKAVFILMGILSFLTVLLGGYVREASRERFVSPSGDRVKGFNRIASYDKIYHPEERADSLRIHMVRDEPEYVAELPRRPERLGLEEETPADLFSSRCIPCHTLERVYEYKGSDWERVVGRMRAYGMKITDEETQEIVDYCEKGMPERGTQDINPGGP